MEYQKSQFLVQIVGFLPLSPSTPRPCGHINHRLVSNAHLVQRTIMRTVPVSCRTRKVDRMLSSGNENVRLKPLAYCSMFAIMYGTMLCSVSFHTSYSGSGSGSGSRNYMDLPSETWRVPSRSIFGRKSGLLSSFWFVMSLDLAFCLINRLPRQWRYMYTHPCLTAKLRR